MRRLPRGWRGWMAHFQTWKRPTEREYWQAYMTAVDRHMIASIKRGMGCR